MNNNEQTLFSALKDALSLSRPEAFTKLDEELKLLEKNFSHQQFNYLFAIAPSPRWFNGALMIPQSIDLLQPFDDHHKISNWTCSQVARLTILLALYNLVEKDTYIACINELFKTADMNELTMLVQSLPHIPEKEAFVERAREAARSNIEQVFCAVAHQSDFAKCFFDAAGWNQLILKAAFLAVPIWPIIGLRERSNPELALMLADYARERQAAGRDLPWDLYCCIGWQAKTNEDMSFLKQQYQIGSEEIQSAILSSLSENGSAKALDTAKSLGAKNEPKSWQEIALLHA